MSLGMTRRSGVLPCPRTREYDGIVVRRTVTTTKWCGYQCQFTLEELMREDSGRVVSVRLADIPA